MIRNIFLFILYALVSSAGLYQVKVYSNNIFSLNFLFGLILYVSAFVIWMIILRLSPLSLAFPIATSAVLIMTQIIGYFLLKETLSPLKLVGVGIIIIGIIILFIHSNK